ncbi:junctophilin-2 isoform X1 [Plutella xylostella]|uniref:junctophilin-2 isoform X1 n=1 Tax=Plutella xylostella TaxID=51655 RepID=UPI002032DF63|nr:junctophilin-2 isoform X1 [Plutella xylostella]
MQLMSSNDEFRGVPRIAARAGGGRSGGAGRAGAGSGGGGAQCSSRSGHRSGVHSAARRGATCPADVYLYRELGGGRAREALPSAAPPRSVMQTSERADAAHAGSGNNPQRGINGGRFDFDDGGTYCGGWEDGKAHGHGVCTGPKGQGAYAGSWHFGFEVSGVYTWPSGSSFEGQWQNGKRHGLGVETRGRWLYRGEWSQGYKGRYGVRQSTTSNAKFEGTWANGLQDGYGSETYADGGTYQGQWSRGMRHGYGSRTSAPFGLASHYRGAAAGAARDARGSMSSLAEAGTPDPAERRTTRMDDARGGFVLKASSDEPAGRRGSLVEKTKKGLFSKLRKQRSAGELDKRGTSSVRSGGSGGSGSSWVSSVDSTHSAMTHGSLHTDSNASFMVEDEHLDASVTETYLGEWKNDKRTGFGVSERSDGLRYEGEWFNNRKYGYGVTTFRDGTREEGKYKNNVLITSQKRKHMFLMRSAKFRERVDSAVNAAQRASKLALQKADIAVSRMAVARGKSEQADEAADQAKEDCDIAQVTAKQFAPDFKHPGFDRIGLRDKYRQKTFDPQVTMPAPQESETMLDGKSIPNHIPPMHAQVPQMNKQMSNAVGSRRPSNQYPRPPQSIDPRLANSPNNYNTDNRALGPPYGSGYNSNQDTWAPGAAQPSAMDNKMPLNEQQPYGTTQPDSQQQQPPYRRTDGIQPQQSIDQANPPFMQQSRRQSAAMRPTLNSRIAQQEWNPTQGTVRRQSVLAQPTLDAQGNPYPDAVAASYGRTELRTGAVYSEQPADPYRQNQDQGAGQGYRPNFDQQGYRQDTDSQMYQQTPSQPQSYRQMPSEPQTYRQPTSLDQDIANGTQNLRQNTSRPSIDYFDHYKRPPSRDGSVDRYGRRSRQASVEATPAPAGAGAGGAASRAGSQAPQPAPAPAPLLGSRAATPAAGNGHLASGRGSISRATSREPAFEESLMRKRNLGQDISPSLYQPKRTESLYVAQSPAPAPAPVLGGGGGGGRKMLSAPQPLQRKKSLPEVRDAAGAGVMSREEVSMLGSARREEVRRMQDESEKLRANPLLYLVSPQVKDWFSRQQLVILVLFINISLGIMFFKLLT